LRAAPERGITILPTIHFMQFNACRIKANPITACQVEIRL